MYRFSWWKDESNSKAVTAIINVLKVIVPAGLVAGGAVAVWLGSKDSELTSDVQPPTPNISFAGDGNVQTGDGMQIVQGDGGTIIVGYAIEEHERILSETLTQLRADLDEASTAKKALLEQELHAVIEKLNNLEASYATAIVELEQLKVLVAEFDGDVPQEQLEAAQKALFEGDRSLADALFAQVETDGQDGIRQIASAKFGRGQIAEAEVRWADAAVHYGEAARLDPNYETLRKAVRFLDLAGNYTQALRFSEDLLSWTRQQGDERQVALALNEHADSLLRLGRYEEAEAFFREAIDIDRRTIGVSHPDYAIDLGNLAVVLEAQGRYSEAEEIYRETLQIVSTTVGKDRSIYATQLNNLGLVLREQERYQEAEELFRQAIDIDRATIGELHPEHATRLNNLALVVHAQGRDAEAEDLYYQVLEIDRALLGAEHPVYAIHLGNLAGLFYEQGRYQEAEALFREVLEIDRVKIGEHHPDYAIDLSNVAGVVEAQGRYHEAEILLRQALDIDLETVGDGHPNYATRLNNLAGVLAAQDKFQEAHLLLEQALVIFRRVLPPSHGHIAIVEGRLAKLRVLLDL